MNYKIYKHTVPDGRVYIGYTSLKPESRWQNGRGYKDNPAFFEVILTEGWNNIKHEILEEVDTIEEAIIKEAECIKLYKSYLPQFGFNRQAPTFQSKKKKIFICEETGQVFNSLKEASESVGVCVSAISRAT